MAVTLQKRARCGRHAMGGWVERRWSASCAGDGLRCGTGATRVPMESPVFVLRVVSFACYLFEAHAMGALGWLVGGLEKRESSIGAVSYTHLRAHETEADL
eukprot:1122261-Rhodomonas_salina.1